MSTPVLLYIAGSNRSGSTLLDLMLASGARVTSVGELRRFDEYVARNKRCTCGLLFKDCEFWNRVSERAGSTRPAPGPESVRMYWKRVEAAGQVAEADVVVDSSKAPRTLGNIIGSANGNLRVIHIIRDGRAVAFSESGRGGAYWRSALRWARVNFAIRRLLAAHKEVPSVTIKYEELCSDPAGVLRDALTRLGIPYDDSMAMLSKAGRHNIGGSQHRFRTQDTKIAADMKWKDKSTRLMRVEFALLAGWLNRRFGYASRP